MVPGEPKLRSTRGMGGTTEQLLVLLQVVLDILPTRVMSDITTDFLLSKLLGTT